MSTAPTTASLRSSQVRSADEPPAAIIPRIIHFTIPANASAAQLQNIERCRQLHPDWKIVVWQDPLDGRGFTLSKLWSKANSGAQLADMIRLEVVFQQGGFYLDSDMVLHRSLEPLRVYSFVVASEDGDVLTNAFFGAAPDSPVLKHLIDDLSEHEVDWGLPPSITTGPEFFAREMKWRDDVTVLPRETFYPYDWNERVKESRLWTYGTHRWDHSWKYSWSSAPRLRQVLRSARHGARQKAIGLRRGLYARLRNFILKFRRQLRVFRPEPYSAEGVLCAQMLHGPRIFLFGDDSSITPEIALHGTYEFAEERFIQRVVNPGDWAIDVGANVGVYTLLLAQQVGTFGRVFSYEPNPLPAALLKKSLVMNWFHDRTVLRPMAVGSEISTQVMRFVRGRMGDASLATDQSGGTFRKTAPLVGDEEELVVDVSTLNHDFPVDLPIRLLKIDAEGFEHHVLRGASRLLSNHCIDILMLECLREVYGRNWNEYLTEIRRILDWGYIPYSLSSNSKLRKTNIRQIMFADLGRNVVFASKHALGTLRGAL